MIITDTSSSPWLFRSTDGMDGTQMGGRVEAAAESRSIGGIQMMDEKGLFRAEANCRG